MKVVFKTFLTIAIASAVIFCFASCGSKEAPPSQDGLDDNPQAHTHIFEDFNIIDNPTCGEDGSMRTMCSCGEESSRPIPATGDHNVVEWNTVNEPTCAQTGLKTGVCTVCDNELTEDIPKSDNHEYGDWIEVTPSTCISTGIKKQVCSICSDEIEGEIPLSTEHKSFENGKCTLCGADEPSKGLTFRLNDTKTGYLVHSIGECTDTVIRIPSTYEGLPVTGIRSSAFEDNTVITSVIIPEGVTSIGSRAFYECTNLVSISLPTGLKKIDSKAFYKCSSLEEITLPDELQSISSEVFYGCSKLKSVVVGVNSAISSIGSKAFYSCDELLEFNTPSGVTSIGTYAFSNCGSLRYIDIPAGLKTIGAYAFNECQCLAIVNIPSDSVLRTIDESAFLNCDSMTSITIPATVSTIGKNAFKNCDVLYRIINKSSLAIGIGVSHDSLINNKAVVYVDKNGNVSYKAQTDGTTFLVTEDDFLFSVKDGVYKLELYLGNKKTVTLPTEINGNSYTLSGVRGLVNVIIPDGFTEINKSAFSNSYALLSISIPNSVTSIGQYAFANANMPGITIPSSVKNIDTYAFFGCDTLDSIVIPKSVESMGSSAFYDCKITVYCEAESQPEGWSSGWQNSGNVTVVWGYVAEN